jgi:hypothetical protein
MGGTITDDMPEEMAPSGLSAAPLYRADSLPYVKLMAAYCIGCIIRSSHRTAAARVRLP